MQQGSILMKKIQLNNFYANLIFFSTTAWLSFINASLDS